MKVTIIARRAGEMWYTLDGFPSVLFKVLNLR